ncbi:MAG: HAD family phosphatase [Pseudonocardia sp.]|nr:HAD family phosphatase [Pseudonocardia sp.]
MFDLDGVLIDSEQVWDAVRRDVVAAAGGRWEPDSTERMQGMSTVEWSAYLGSLGVPGPPSDVATQVIDAMANRYGTSPPLLPGAVEAVRAIAAVLPAGLASSSPRRLIDIVLTATGLTRAFAVTMSTEEVAHGKPSPDVYLAVAARLGVAPIECVAVEDSSNGLRSAAAAGMRVVAVPNPHYPPAADALALASIVVPDVRDVTPDLIAALP